MNKETNHVSLLDLGFEVTTPPSKHLLAFSMVKV